jgi:hypothetical protein
LQWTRSRSAAARCGGCSSARSILIVARLADMPSRASVPSASAFAELHRALCTVNSPRQLRFTGNSWKLATACHTWNAHTSSTLRVSADWFPLVPERVLVCGCVHSPREKFGPISAWAATSAAAASSICASAEDACVVSLLILVFEKRCEMMRMGCMALPWDSGEVLKSDSEKKTKQPCTYMEKNTIFRFKLNINNNTTGHV